MLYHKYSVVFSGSTTHLNHDYMYNVCTVAIHVASLSWTRELKLEELELHIESLRA